MSSTIVLSAYTENVHPETFPMCIRRCPKGSMYRHRRHLGEIVPSGHIVPRRYMRFGGFPIDGLAMPV